MRLRRMSPRFRVFILLPRSNAERAGRVSGRCAGISLFTYQTILKMEYLSRSKAAFRLSCQTFIEQSFEERRRCALWTFTFPKCIDAKEAFAIWSKFARRLHQWGIHPLTKKQTVYGIRVAELHPGGHGTHFHVLINRYVNWHFMDRLWRKYGGGHCNVKRIKRNKAERVGHYLAKYLAKSTRPVCFQGRRVWQAFGKWGQTRCKDVVIESEFVAAFKARRKILEAAKRVHERMNIPYRLETNLETMEHAKMHVWRVSMGLAEPHLPHLWYSPPELEPPRADFEDWQGAFSELTHGRN